MKSKPLFILLCIVLIILIVNLGRVKLLGLEPESRGSKAPKDDKLYLKGPIESALKNKLGKEVKFSTVDYAQWDPMEIQLYHINNTFKFKGSSTKHTYNIRAGIDENNVIQLFYLSIDGEDIFWEEEQEDIYIEEKGE